VFLQDRFDAADEYGSSTGAPLIVIVVGTHCSGGSAVAALLQRHGVAMGFDDLPLSTGVAGDRDASFENPRFRILNDRIAERQGYVIASWKPEIPVFRPGAITRLRMRRLIRSFDERHSVWGFKDPRCCITLDAWLREIERIDRLGETRIIYTVRDPDAAVRAMTWRTGIDSATALRLWKSYNERALSTIDAWQPATHYVSYEDLEDHADRATTALLRFIGLFPNDGPGAALAFAEPSGSVISSESEALAKAVTEMKSRMSRRVRESLRSAARETE